MRAERCLWLQTAVSRRVISLKFSQLTISRQTTDGRCINRADKAIMRSRTFNDVNCMRTNRKIQTKKTSSWLGSVLWKPTFSSCFCQHFEQYTHCSICNSRVFAIVCSLRIQHSITLHTITAYMHHIAMHD